MVLYLAQTYGSKEFLGHTLGLQMAHSSQQEQNWKWDYCHLALSVKMLSLFTIYRECEKSKFYKICSR